MADICSELAFPVGEKAFVGYIASRSALINKNYPEFHVFRDVGFYLLYVQNVDVRVFPPVAGYSQQSVELKWSFQQGAFHIESFSTDLSSGVLPKTPIALPHTVTRRALLLLS